MVKFSSFPICPKCSMVYDLGAILTHAKSIISLYLANKQHKKNKRKKTQLTNFS